MTEENKQALEVLLANRLYLYALLHKIFGRDPDAAILELLTSDTTVQAFTLLSEKEDDIMARVPHFLGELKKDAESTEFMDSLKVEYTRLFVGPAKFVAPAWESVYRGKEQMLFQECTLEVRRFYKKHGIEHTPGMNIADDSLALELDFMNHMAQRAQYAFNENNQAALVNILTASQTFLQEHLLVWIPKFLERMKDAPTDLLYPQMSLILDDYLKKDDKVLTQCLAVLL